MCLKKAKINDLNSIVSERNDLRSLHTYSKVQVGETSVPLLVSPTRNQDLIYHYRSIDTFWKIVETNVFRATQVRFSNDDEEYKQGDAIFKSIEGEPTKDKYSPYMICFSGKKNLLSQWRAYAKKGLSIGMDFSRLQCFSILPIDEKKYKPLIIPAIPIEVLYTHGCDGIAEEKKPCKGESPLCHGDTCKRIKNCHFKNTSNDTPCSFEDLKNWYEKSADHLAKIKFANLVPYMKHGDFEEEKESRLIFPIPREDEYKYLKHDYNEVGEIKRPYCEVKFTGIETNEAPYIQLGKDVDSKHIEKIEKIAKKYKRTAKKELAGDNQPEGDCIYISMGKKTEETQEDLFRELDEAVNKDGNPTKIWCDGFWPIREILVGPTPKKELIAENIRHYCTNRYWLKYVDVNYTRTPFRE